MLLALTQWLAQDVRAFNVFQYITLRAVLATLTALAISLLAGPLVIRKLTAYKIGQAVRNDGPQSHLAKAGTPTMGGAIGWIDDYRKVVKNNPKGLSPKAKFLWQSLIGLVAAVYLAFAVSAPSTAKVFDLFVAWVGSGFSMELPSKADLIVPFAKNVAYPLGVFGFITLSYFVIVGTSNAVNLTDGLDGLAIMPAVMCAGGRAGFAMVLGTVDYSRYLLFPYIPGAGELTVVCRALFGAGLGFLWFNAYPADVFMGDVGALSLGAALGTVAVIVRQEIVLFIMGGVFVAETVSVMLQVLYFKWSGGKRIFRMAPLHHHYELSGWKESQVVVRFWIITMMLVLFGLSTLKLR